MKNSSGKCLLCGRKLRDAESLKRGYGPKCWEKVAGPRPPAGLRAAGPSISNSGLASIINEKILDKIANGETKTCNCGELLINGELKSYDHSEGYNLRGYSLPQWVFLKCSKCGYMWNISKLRISLSDLEKKSLSNSFQTQLDETETESLYNDSLSQ